jgi:hypothetical protein
VAAEVQHGEVTRRSLVCERQKQARNVSGRERRSRRARVRIGFFGNATLPEAED